MHKFVCILWCLSAFTSLPLALKAFHLAAVAFSTYSFHQQVSGRHWWGWVVLHTSSVVLSRPVLMLFQISLVAASATPADALTCELKTSWKWLLVWGFQTYRWGANLCLDFGGRSVLMLHTRSRCCRATSSPGITFTSVTSLRIILRKRMKSICVATFPDLYVMRWLSRFLKHVFPRSRLNARAYSRVLPPSSGSSLPYLISSCTSLYSVPARPSMGLHVCSNLHMDQKFRSWDPGSYST